jgi:hypothetical protein
MGYQGKRIPPSALPVADTFTDSDFLVGNDVTAPEGKRTRKFMKGLFDSLYAGKQATEEALAGKVGKGDLFINLKDAPFNAKGNGVADDTAAFQAALTYAGTLSRAHVFIPPGTYVITGALTLPGNIRISGGGIEATRLKWSETDNCFDRPVSGSTIWERIAIEDLTIEGTRATTTASSGKLPINIYKTNHVRIERVRLEDCRYFGIVVRQSNFVSVTNCHLWQISRDAISCSTCVYVNISDNTIDHCDDDAITAHSFDSEGSKIWRSVIVSDNRISDAQGITLLGGNRVAVTGNQIERCRLRGIFVGLNAPEGYSSPHSITITGNSVTDIFNRQTIDGLSNAGDYIVIGGARQAGGLAAIPGEPDGTGAFVSLYDNLQNNGASVALSGAAHIVISGNVVGRTLPIGVAYSSYGRGQMFTRNGYIDPTITAEILTAGAGVRLSTALRDAAITGNVIKGVGAGVSFTGGTNTSYQNIIISNNTFSDLSLGGIVCGAAATKGRTIIVSGNVFDGDPFHTHPNRGGGGTWLADGSLRALWVQNATGFVIKGNTFKNFCVISDVLLSAGDNKAVFLDNIAECDPVAQGFSTSNRGIGNIPRGGRKVIFRIVDCNPASASYGTIRNNCEVDRNTAPTTGTYVVGHFVQNNAPTISTGKVLQGWLRITTGSAHVIGTDWAPVYGTTS